MTLEWLSDDQAQQFRQSGYLTVTKCFGPDDARPWIDRTWRRLGMFGEAPRPVLAGVEAVHKMSELGTAHWWKDHQPGPATSPAGAA